MIDQDQPPATGTSPPRRLPGPDDFPEQGVNSLGAIGLRAGARIVDELLFAFPLQVIESALIMSTYGVTSLADLPRDYRSPLWLIALGLVLGAVYEVITVAVWGRTLGKWAFGLRVARYTDGGTPTWSQAALRCLLPTAVAAAAFGLNLPTGVAAAVFISAAFDPLRRGWHDKAGGTVVVATR